jgi:hypothetical protein
MINYFMPERPSGKDIEYGFRFNHRLSPMNKQSGDECIVQLSVQLNPKRKSFFREGSTS